MTESSPRLELPYLMPSQAQKHITHNEALKRLDSLVQLSVETLSAETPPVSPAPGAVHGLGPAPTGAWAGQAGKLAVWDGASWSFLAPQEGWHAWDRSLDGMTVYKDGAWVPVAIDSQNLAGMGIGTTYDGTNRLSVQSEASLFSHDGGSHRMKINKAGAADTASLLFQSGWTGHAEMGLTGTTDFALKVSPDGSAWHEALTVDAGAGEIALAPAGTVRATFGDAGLALNVPLTGTAVQFSPTDATDDRLLTTGAFGLGGRDLSAVVIHDAHDDLASGFYAGDGAGSLNYPGGASYRPFLNMNRRRGAGAYLQVRMFIGTDNVPVLRSSSDAGATWSADNTVYGTLNVVGTVSETAGTPTGAVIERGSNANGEYVRFADGTQICTRTVTLDGVDLTQVGSTIYYSSGAENYPFPSSFATVDHVSATLLASDIVTVRTSGHIKMRFGSTVIAAKDWSNVAVLALASHTGTPGEETTFTLYAVGRWF